jgi:hypothetical protein
MNRAFWHSIRDHNYAVPEGFDITDLTLDLLDYLGSPDPDLRDDIAYYTLAYWVARGHYTPDQLRGLAMQLVANLSVGLGEQETDSVFRRSFSALMLGEIVRRDNKTPFLSPNEVGNLLRWSLEYLADERDLRGYSPEHGWIHAAAHTADLLRMLAQSRFVTANDLETILMALADKITRPTSTIYVHDEDERLVEAVFAVLGRNLLTRPFLASWLERLVAVMGLAPKDAPFDPETHAAYQNTKHFLRSLYIRLISVKTSQTPLLRSLRPMLLTAVEAVNA